MFDWGLKYSLNLDMYAPILSVPSTDIVNVLKMSLPFSPSQISKNEHWIFSVFPLWGHWNMRVACVWNLDHASLRLSLDQSIVGYGTLASMTFRGALTTCKKSVDS